MDGTIVSVVVGGLIATGTSVLTNLWTDHREQKRWGEERRREADQRVYEHRRAALVDFLTQFRETFDKASLAKMYGQLEDPPEDVLDDLGTRLTLVKLYSSEDLGRKAEESYRQLGQYVFSGGDSVKVARAFEKFIAGANELLTNTQ